ncbi:ankyrin repeat and LEM domain-containing protein 1 [Astyanax mexicanus]|uniref:ankyrin repeat and LEM domain-containing protein 1 n=1 Tax=Astyanax mexicanus TaxID=7994 RepID=UPI0020CB19B0|nr:ankyrin repeat and LEM domain-containing protein 1 [Astyanax mexicanus]
MQESLAGPDLKAAAFCAVYVAKANELHAENPLKVYLSGSQKPRNTDTMPLKSRDSDPASLLYTAVNDTDLRTVESLLLQGVNPNLMLPEGLAAVHLAAGKESEKGLRCLKLILQHGADPNLRSSEDLTPLHIAASWGCYQNLKLLLKNGGNPSLKDHDGNKPADLAEQEENSKCASLLQEFESQAPQVEYEDMPKFQYSIYSGHSLRDSSIDLSMLSNFGEGPLSSTRQSSFFRMSGISGQPFRDRGAHDSWLSDVSGLNRRESEVFDRTEAFGDTLPVLSSTRLSVIDFKSPEWEALPKNEDFCLNSERSAQFLQPSRKSVTFRDSNEYFPAQSFRSPDGRTCENFGDTTVDFSQYSDFLDSGRMTTVLQNQGIDVTSPDNVFVFCRGGSMREEDFEKTIMGPGLLEELSGDEHDDDNNNDDVFSNSVNEVKSNNQAPVFSSSGSSKYSSCDSDQYKTAIEGSEHNRHFSPLEKEEILGDEHGDAAKESHGESHSSGLSTEESDKGSINLIADQSTKTQTGDKSQPHSSILETEEQMNTPSPFVTGRTRSRLSRCSQRCSNISPSVFSTSSLFEHTLPTPTRVRRNTPQHKYPHNSEETQSGGHCFEENGLDDINVSMRNLKVSSVQSFDENPSQADTLIISESLADTVIIPRSDAEDGSEGDSVSCQDDVISSSYSSKSPVRQHAEIMLDAEREFLTSDVSTSSERQNNAPVQTAQTSYKSSYALRENCRAYGDESSQSQTVTSLDCSRPQRGRVYNGGTSSCTPRNTKSRVCSQSEPQTGSVKLEQHSSSPPVFEDEREFLTSDASTSSERRKCAAKPMQTPYRSSYASNEHYCEISSQEESSPSQASLESGSSSSLDSSRPQKSRAEGSSSGCTPRYSMSRLNCQSRPQTLANLSYTPGGRPIITDMDEPVEYLYTDTEEGHELIETHVPPTSNSSMSSSVLTSTSEDTVLYDWRTLQAEGGSPEKEKENRRPSREDALDTKGLTDRELRRRLVELGERPGPINAQTRPLYIQRLRALQNTSATQQKAEDSSSAFTAYTPELNKVLSSFHLPDCKADEFALCEQFDQPDQNKKWREGIIKSSFNYLLLDPRVTKNLPYRSHSMTPQERFQTFVSAIFYVGKGKRSRPYSHLYEALEYFRGDKTSKKLCSKVQHILQVWNSGQGVISLHCFQNVIPVEAYTREACMVDAIGLKMLTNKKRGDYYGVVSTWTAKRKRELGVHLLYRAMQIFLAEGERQLRPADIRLGQ